MNVFKKITTNFSLNCKKACFKSIKPEVSFKSFTSSLTLSKQNSFFGSYNKAFFSSKEKDSKTKESSTDEENTKDRKKEENSDEDATDERVENNSAMEKYKQLKTLYTEQSHKLETTRKKFEEIRQAYLNNVQETNDIKLRYEKEIANTKEFAITKFAKDILDVHDNFGRAMATLEGKEFQTLSAEDQIELFNNFVEGNFLFLPFLGIESTNNGLVSILRKNGVVEYKPLKEKFDPHKHEAVFDYDDEELNAGTVGQVLQSGFKIGERVLRPAKVGVVKKKSV